ncbi:putative membrane protein [Allocatelliglobosispora scoriae]|uniref:Putative membrane protein n=1 Tax=Allocatelliglobosispora scoriae TaxID=643052 RepID=A0A841BPI6_9ACTN|nr:glycosyltransferase 87 family protein [Allocatelliglobosispora scoriae]MBB5870987.1 putative membrane protein [Allocatelliglobosispora scoriae]
MSSDTGTDGRRLVETSGGIDAPSRSDGFVAGLSQAVGGPMGDHAVPGRWSSRFWIAARIIIALTCATLALSFLQKSPCRSGAWADSLQYTKFCYTDVLALYGAEGLSDGKVPYVDTAVEYPVLTGAFMGLIGLPVHSYGVEHPEFNQYQAFYDITALALFGCAIATVAMLLAIRRRRPWDVAMFAVSPVLLVTATVNWDLLAIVFAVGGIWAWSKRNPALAGLLIGLGAAAKLWPGFLFVPLFALALRSLHGKGIFAESRSRTASVPGEPEGSTRNTYLVLARDIYFRARRGLIIAWRYVVAVSRQTRSFLLAAVTGIGVILAANVPVMVTHYDNWHRFISLNTERAVDWGTFWYVGRWADGLFMSGQPGDRGLFQWLSDSLNNPDDRLLNDVTLGLFVIACIGIIALTYFAPQEPRLAQLAFLVVAIFLLFNKVWSQQFTLWLLPLIVLARPRWGAFLLWQVAELGYFLAFYGELLGASGKSVIPEGTFIIAATFRWVMVAALCVMVVREILNPELDVVRRTPRYGKLLTV